MKKKILSIFLSLSLILTAAAAMTVTAEAKTTETQKIHLKNTSVSIEIGDTYKIKLLNKNNKTIAASNITWSSSDSSVAVVSKKGTVSGKKEGSAIINAKYKGKIYKCTVSVCTPYLSDELFKMSSGDKKELIMWTKNSSGEKVKIDPKKVEWSSTDTSVCTVTSKGIVKAKKTGSSIVIATYLDKVYTKTVYVDNGLRTDADYLIFSKTGDTKTLTVTYDGEGNLAYNMDSTCVDVEWKDVWNGNSTTFTITSKYGGFGTLRIYDTKNHNAYREIDISVNLPSSEQIQLSTNNLYYSQLGYTQSITAITRCAGTIECKYDESVLKVTMKKVSPSNITTGTKNKATDSNYYKIDIKSVAEGKGTIAVCAAENPKIYQEINYTVYDYMSEWLEYMAKNGTKKTDSDNNNTSTTSSDIETEPISEVTVTNTLPFKVETPQGSSGWLQSLTAEPRYENCIKISGTYNAEQVITGDEVSVDFVLKDKSGNIVEQGTLYIGINLEEGGTYEFAQTLHDIESGDYTLTLINKEDAD